MFLRCFLNIGFLETANKYKKYGLDVGGNPSERLIVEEKNVSNRAFVAGLAPKKERKEKTHISAVRILQGSRTTAILQQHIVAVFRGATDQPSRDIPPCRGWPKKNEIEASNAKLLTFYWVQLREKLLNEGFIAREK